MNPPPSSDPALIDALVVAAIEAGTAIVEIRKRGLRVEKKADHSPVTEADRAAEAIIVRHLAVAAPGVPVVGEEGASDGRIPVTGDAFFLVDPLDGTREFAKGGNDFTVNIGLVRAGVPSVGVILVPASGKLYGGAIGSGAWRAEVKNGVAGPRSAIRVRPVGELVDVVASRSHRTKETDDYIARYEVGRLVQAGSSLKFCAIAAGEADLYPRMGTTMQWDTAAGEAILRAAGGKVVGMDGRPLPYGPGNAEGAEAFRNPWFIATGGMEPVLG